MDEKTIPLNKLPVDVKVQLSKDTSWNKELDYRALFEQMGDCVFIIGLDFKVITVNPQVTRLLGYSEGELLGMPVEHILSLDDSMERERILEQRLNVSEHTLRKKDGFTLPVELSISVVHNKENLPAYVQLIARDITERKQHERMLKRNMRAQSVIGEVTAVLFRSSNIEARLPEVLESLGYAVGVFGCVVFEAKNSTLKIKYEWVDPAHPEFEAEKVIIPFLDSLEKFPDRVFSIPEVPVKLPDGSKISMLAIPVQGALGSWGFLGLFGGDEQTSRLPTSFDIVQTTANLIGAAIERMHYEETLRLSERRNRIIVDALPDLLLRVDRSGRIFDYNVNLDHPLYLEASDVIGKNLSALWNEEIVGKLLPRLPEESVFTLPRTVENFSLPGREGIFEARLFPLSKVEALIIVRDVTDQARLNQMKSDFINRASHELRTPLTSAILMAELLRIESSEEEKQQYLETLLSELNRQKNLINQLLMAGRLESGALRVEPSIIDVTPILQDSIAAVMPIANKRNIRILFTPPSRPYLIKGDVSGLQQVFINLINNAVKFSPEGSDVEVETTRLEGETRIAISDRGMGIPPDAMPHLFERFYRARNVSAAEISGSGIGLYIVKSILGELGGSISVTSKVNEGTTFTVGLKNG